MPNTPVTKQVAYNLGVLILLGMIVQLCVIGYVWYDGYQRRVENVVRARAACERNKADRIDNAEFQRAHEKYINQVVLAKSVEEDVKKAAREAVKTYNRTAESLTKRSQIDCDIAFPKARLL